MVWLPGQRKEEAGGGEMQAVLTEWAAFRALQHGKHHREEDRGKGKHKEKVLEGSPRK